MKKIAFTLCSNNYLSQAKTLGESLVRFNPDIDFVIGVVDKLHASIDYSFFSPFEILPYSSLGYPEFEEMITRYNIVEFNTAVKPFYIDHFFSKHPGCQVYYIDPDIEIFHSFEEMDNIFSKGYDFILTPHLVELRLEKSKFEKQILNVGIYNLGFLGISSSDRSKVFVAWWKERLRYDCRIDFCKGMFVDQLWVNFLPAFFDNVYTLRDPGYNMGYWNFTERILSFKGGCYWVNDTHKLKFFHFSSYNPLAPDILCKHLKYSFDKRQDLAEIYKNYRDKLLANKYQEFSVVERLLSFKENHPYADKKNDLRSRLKKRLRKLFKS